MSRIPVQHGGDSPNGTWHCDKTGQVHAGPRFTCPQCPRPTDADTIRPADRVPASTAHYRSIERRTLVLLWLCIAIAAGIEGWLIWSLW